MKNVWLFFALIVLCGCNTDNDFYDNMDQNIVTRSSDASTTDYYFYSSSPRTEEYDYVGGSDGYQIYSYIETGEGVTAIEPELISKPDWVTNFFMIPSYYGYALVIIVSKNDTDRERAGTLELIQPHSLKRLSIPVFQRISTNTVTINVTSPYANHFIFTATTTYPVKEAVTIRIPYEVYNDGGELKNQSARIDITKNQTTGTYVMNYDASPLVAYHGNVKGYRLYEGTFSTNDIHYNYSFNRYW